MYKFERMQQHFADNMKLGDDLNSSSHSKSMSSIKDCKRSTRFKANEIVCFGDYRNIDKVVAECEDQDSFLCILCQQGENMSEDTSPMILLCYTQRSRILSKEKNDLKHQRISSIKTLNHLNGVNTTTCGHTMHSECWEKYTNSISLHNTILNKELGETFCPLCETISNIIISISHKRPESYTLSSEVQFPQFENWFTKIQQNILEVGYEIKSTSEYEYELEEFSHRSGDNDLNNNRLLIDLKRKRLLDEYAINCTKLTSFKTHNNFILYHTILSNCAYTIQVTGNNWIKCANL